MGRVDGSYQEQQVIYAVKTLDNYGWRVVGVSYINELVTAKETEVFGIVIVILVIIFFVTFVSSYIMSCVVSKPIQRLVNDMGEFEKKRCRLFLQPHGRHRGNTISVPVLWTYGETNPEPDESGQTRGDHAEKDGA